MERILKNAQKRESEFQKSRLLVFKLVYTLDHYFPDLISKLQEIEEYRELPRYQIEELVFAAIMLHFFKSRSRNEFNNLQKQRKFEINYYRAFKLSLPHADTVDLLLRKISPEVLEQLKTYFVKILIEKKIFYKFRILNRSYNISIDATGLMTIDEKNIKNHPNAIRKVYNEGSENEKVVYFIYVLEAKLVCKNGFCISIGTEWIENPLVEFEKQDCELKAFARLAEKIKKDFPRLPICIVGDGLYPNQNIFKICEKNNWDWIFTFKDGNLKTVHEEIEILTYIGERNEITKIRKAKVKDEDGKIIELSIEESYQWIKSIRYGDFEFNYACLEFIENNVKHKFVYITSLDTTNHSIIEIIEAGRMRFKIENEGFNCQKNNGYKLKHKFSRSSEIAMKNYYNCIQIAHIFNQLFDLQRTIRDEVKGRNTIVNIWVMIKSIFSLIELLPEEFEVYTNAKKQIKFE